MSETLGTITQNVSTTARQRRYKLQAVAARMLPKERVSWCSRSMKAPVLEIRKSGEKAYYHGLAVCGSPWLCPVCSARIAQERRSELTKAASSGYSMLLVTLTLQHSRGDKLSTLLTALNSAWRKTRAGRAWQKLEAKYQLVASASSLEITYSQENGFHPHKHVVYFSTLPESELQVAEFEAELSARWRKILEKSGEYGSEYYAVDVRTGEAPVAEYLAKNWSVAEELALAQAKNGNSEHFNMWQVLERAGNGEKWALAAFREYAQAVKNKRQLFWSAGARALFHLAEEKSEQEIAASEPEEHELVYSLTREVWRVVCERELRGELLSVAEQSGSRGVFQFLEKLRGGVT